jgi:hypothetical protein
LLFFHQHTGFNNLLCHEREPPGALFNLFNKIFAKKEMTATGLFNGFSYCNTCAALLVIKLPMNSITSYRLSYHAAYNPAPAHVSADAKKTNITACMMNSI